MIDVMVFLKLEHKDMARLLDLLGEQRARLEQGNEADYGLLRSILEYVSEFPDRCHHPKEDLVFQKFKEKAPDAASRLTDLLADHENLAQETAALSETIERAATDRAHELVLGDELGRFLVRYRHHMAIEESEFFPAALAALTPTDWGAIDTTLFDGPDPLFDDEVEDRFRSLRGHIDRLAEVRHRQYAAEQESRLLRGLQTLDAFNQHLEETGDDARLQQEADGSYCVERHGRELARIPACSESRAAWCAHYVLRGERDATQGRF